MNASNEVDISADNVPGAHVDPNLPGELVEDKPAEQPATPEEAKIAQALPKCPHCGDDPVKLTLMFQQFPKGQIASIISCGKCRALFSAQIVGMNPAQEDRIVKPGR